jgi:hypothetical protein
MAFLLEFLDDLKTVTPGASVKTSEARGWVSEDGPTVRLAGGLPQLGLRPLAENAGPT